MKDNKRTDSPLLKLKHHLFHTTTQNHRDAPLSTPEPTVHHLPSWVKNLCSVSSVGLSSIPATLIAYPIQRLVMHTQLNGVKVSVEQAAKDMFRQAQYPQLRYLMKNAPYALMISPIFKAGYATPMLIAKDYAHTHHSAYPQAIYYGGALSTVFLQVAISFDMRMKQLADPNLPAEQRPKHYWKSRYIKQGLMPWTSYMFVANLSSLIFYDKAYELIRERYPQWSVWTVGAAASVASLPISQVLITPVDTWSARAMSSVKMAKIHKAAYRRVYWLRIVWKLLENGFLLTSSYALKDAMLDWMLIRAVGLEESVEALTSQETLERPERLERLDEETTPIRRLR